MKKKGDISIGIIIAAAIGVLVLVIMAVTFTSQMRKTTEDLQSGCEKMGGTMLPVNPAATATTSPNCPDGKTEIVKYSKTTQRCCIDLG